MANAAWQNGDGLTVRFPNYYKDPSNFTNRLRGLEEGLGQVKQAEFDYDLTKITAGTTYFPRDLNNDGTNDGFDTGDFYLPANSSILRATLIATVGATGGTSFTMGTYTLTGSAVAATGIITATEGVIANIATAGQRVYGAGSLVSATAGTAGVGTADVFVTMAVVGTFTAGKGKIFIDYIDALPDT